MEVYLYAFKYAEHLWMNQLLDWMTIYKMYTSLSTLSYVKYLTITFGTFYLDGILFCIERILSKIYEKVKALNKRLCSFFLVHLIYMDYIYIYIYKHQWEWCLSFPFIWGSITVKELPNQGEAPGWLARESRNKYFSWIPSAK